MTKAILLSLLVAGCTTTNPVYKPTITSCPELPVLTGGNGKSLLPWILSVKALYGDCKAKVEALKSTGD